MTVAFPSQNQTRLSSLDRSVEEVAAPEQVGDYLFAVVDLLEDQPSLRRALSDPSREPEERQEIVTRLLQGKISEQTLDVVKEAVALRWSSGRSLSAALERQGVRAMLIAALRFQRLDAVEEQLFSIARSVAGSNELREALADGSAPLASRQALMSRLVDGKVDPQTARLIGRAVGARERTFGLTLEHYLSLAAQLRERQIAHVTVARPMTPDQEQRLRAALSRQAGRDVDLQVDVDPAVLGGVRVVLGDDVIEGTVARRLEDVRRQLG